MKTKLLLTTITLQTSLAVGVICHATFPLKDGGEFMTISHNTMSEKDQIPLATKLSIIDELIKDFDAMKDQLKVTSSTSQDAIKLENYLEKYNKSKKKNKDIHKLIDDMREIAILNYYFQLTTEITMYGLPLSMYHKASNFLKKNHPETKAIFNNKDKDMPMNVFKLAHKLGFEEITSQILEDAKVYAQFQEMLTTFMRRMDVRV